MLDAPAIPFNRHSEAPWGVCDVDCGAVVSPEIDGAGLSLAPPLGVILATRRAREIAAADPKLIVVDPGARRVWRGPDRVEFGWSGKRSKLWTFCLAITLSLGQDVFRDDIVELIWGNEANGGPLNVTNSISVYLYFGRPYFHWAGLFPRVAPTTGKILIEAAERRPGVWRSFRLGMTGISQCGVTA